MNPIDLLEDWRTRMGADYSWSIGGPYKGARTSANYRVTLYKYQTPRWTVETCRWGESLTEAVEAAILSISVK